MVTDEQLLTGTVKYFKSEVIAKLPGAAKLAAGAALIHNAGRLSGLFNSMQNYLNVIEVYNPDGLIDIDRWQLELAQAMDEYCGGKLEVSIPGLNVMTFYRNDIECLCDYIRGNKQ